MSASNNNQEESNSNSNTSMTINSLGINKRDIDQISRIVSDESFTNDNSKRRKLSGDLADSHNHPFHHHHVRVPQGRKRPLSPRSSPPVLKPCNYLMKLFHNKDLPTATTTRIDSFSIEQAFYFEAYQEAEISTDILQALRSSNVEQLRSFLKDTKKNGLKECRNQFGENLLHLACRMGGISSNVIAFLVQEAKVPLNVRDRFGRTPLHHACMSSHPNFDTIDFVIRHIPRMVLLFQDDTGNIPFDLIPSRCYDGWTRFLSETKNILHNNNNKQE
eukprot:CAMPEP_0170775546 /NCGR_PEP_ID=MMETSP0733-20121128/10648_1 /TAXON_ID=186038 /ORGANISM="Fragilariopsis kerguelensis, Strain L26-C5" /LENGTH=274 /DNA_ID=CAMNT_0011118375 /DNA_START=62 /DNA_END=886 /DNA_ORIENTATION=-